MSQVTNKKPVSTSLPVVKEEADVSFGDRLLESARPHANLILLGLAALFLLFVAVAWMLQSRAQVAEGEWISLNQAMAVANVTGNTSGIKEVADEFPDGRAGLWGLQLAGDFELRRGLDRLANDRTEGIREIEKARNTLKKIVDAPASRKSTLLQVRSTFSLAYAYESLGDLENARQLYQRLADQAPDSAFGQAAQRGLNRVSNPAFAKVYDRFKDWEDPFAEAPADSPTEKPDISFPEVPDSPTMELPGAAESSGAASEESSDAASEESSGAASEDSSEAAGETADPSKE